MTWRVRGRLKFFDPSRGFGFASIEGMEDTFIHARNFDPYPPKREPKADDVLEFDLGASKDGRSRAERITFVDDLD